MAGLLKELEKRIEDRIQARMGPLAMKMDEMIKLLRQIEEHLGAIRKNMEG